MLLYPTAAFDYHPKLVFLGRVRKGQNLHWGTESLPGGQETKSSLGNRQPAE